MKAFSVSERVPDIEFLHDYKNDFWHYYLDNKKIAVSSFTPYSFGSRHAVFLATGLKSFTFSRLA